MNLPLHRLKDFRDGMNPEIVNAVYCVRCEAFVGRWRELAEREEFDEDMVECEDCLNRGGEEDV